MSIPHTQILVSNTILQEEESELLREISVSNTKAGNTQHKPGIYYSAKSKEVLKKLPILIIDCVSGGR